MLFPALNVLVIYKMDEILYSRVANDDVAIGFGAKMADTIKFLWQEQVSNFENLPKTIITKIFEYPTLISRNLPKITTAGIGKILTEIIEELV